MRSAHHLMLVNICMKFHEGNLNGFWVTERTRPYRKIYFQFQRAITPKIHNPELQFLCSARRLMLLYICVKFHENISSGFWVTERTWFCDRQMDGRTTRAKTICLPRSPNPTGGDIVSPNNADGMANSVDPDQEKSDLGLHCLPRHICPKNLGSLLLENFVER